MSYSVHILDDSPDLLVDILDNIGDQPGKELTCRIIGLFIDAELPVKVKHHEYGTPWQWYRVSCCNRKNIESVIINTKTGYGKSAAAGLHLQIRINNPRAFDRLDEFSPNIRAQILTGRDCCFCPTGCKGSVYIFAYQGNTFVKCKNIGSNFRFGHIEENDIASILEIVSMEVNGHD